MGSPDDHVPHAAHASAWTPLFVYGGSLDANLASAFHVPLQIQMDNARIKAHTQLALLRSAHADLNTWSFENDEHENAATRRAVLLAKNLYTNLPQALCAEYGVLSVYDNEGEVELDSGTLGPQVLVDVVMERVIMREARAANELLEKV